MQSFEKKEEQENLLFERKDLAIFKIPDIKTKLSTLQNYFFPRLEVLLRYSLDTIAQVYDINPYEKMTFVYRPSHRETAKNNKDYDAVHIGITAQKGDKPLSIFKKNGEPFTLHPTYLTYQVLPSGSIYVELLPFRQNVDHVYVQKVSNLIKDLQNKLTPLLSLAHISYESYRSYCDFSPLYEAINIDETGIFGIRLLSPKYYFPIDAKRGINELILAFIVLYALADSFILLGEGHKPRLDLMIERFKEWYINSCNLENILGVQIGENEIDALLPESLNLESYNFIRAGKWWQVLARDKWKCLSCGRSARKDNVLLEVDHIIPRSKGGSDELSNLQTLCKKCNIGKSNKDDTDLTLHSDI